MLCVDRASLVGAVREQAEREVQAVILYLRAGATEAPGTRESSVLSYPPKRSRHGSLARAFVVLAPGAAMRSVANDDDTGSGTRERLL